MAVDDDQLGTNVLASSAEQTKPPLSCEVKVESPNACQRHVTVVVSRADIDRYLTDAVAELMPKAEVPGFRPGRAPRKLVEHRFSKELKEQIKGTLLMDAISQVTEDEKFAAIGEPDFDYDAVEVPDEGPLTFEFDLEVRPEFDLPDWKGLKLEKPAREFSREDIDRQLARLLEQQAEVVPTDEPACREDFVTLNAVFSHDGKTVSQAEEVAVRVRPVLSFPDARLEGFDKLMEGVRPGDTRETTVKISDDTHDERLRGKEITAKFEVLEVKRVQLPELNEELLGRLGDFENEGELRDAIKSSLERRMEYQQQRRVRDRISELLTQSADWELPPELLRRQSHRELERAILDLQAAGFGENEIRAYENQLRQNSLKSTERALKEHFILERIAEVEDIQENEEDYDREIALIAMQSEESPRRVRARLEKRGQMDVLRNQIIERKVIDLIEQNAQFVEVDYPLEEDDTEAVDFTIGSPDHDEIPEAKHAGGEATELPKQVDHS